MENYKVQELENIGDLGALMERKDWINYNGIPALFLKRKLNGIEIAHRKDFGYEKSFSLERDLVIKNNGIETTGLTIGLSLTKEEYKELTR